MGFSSFNFRWFAEKHRKSGGDRQEFLFPAKSKRIFRNFPLFALGAVSGENATAFFDSLSQYLLLFGSRYSEKLSRKKRGAENR